MDEPPIRLCCMTRHYGPVCPDGKVMCCLCFERFDREQLNVLEPGVGLNTTTAPVYEDVCKQCAMREGRVGRV